MLDYAFDFHLVVTRDGPLVWAQGWKLAARHILVQPERHTLSKELDAIHEA